jgi:phosphoglycolate phosphatase
MLQGRHMKIVFWDFSGTIVRGSGLILGITDVLQQLAQDHMQIVVSSLSTASIEQALGQYNLRPYFKDLLGSDVAESKAERCRLAMRRYNVVAKDCVFITDTLRDVAEATEAGVSAITVTWGYHDRATLEKGNPTAIVDTPADLISTIQALLRA